MKNSLSKLGVKKISIIFLSQNKLILKSTLFIPLLKGTGEFFVVFGLSLAGALWGFVHTFQGLEQKPRLFIYINFKALV